MALTDSFVFLSFLNEKLKFAQHWDARSASHITGRRIRMSITYRNLLVSVDLDLQILKGNIIFYEVFRLASLSRKI